MFVGHYSAAFLAKRVEPRVPLWLLFIAAQLVDIIWDLFVLLGIEKLRLVPGITASNPLDLYYMPYTHSLVAAVVWAVAAGLLSRRAGWVTSGQGALLVGLVVASHWVLDFVVHRPDLPLLDDSMKVGLGLWKLPLVSLALEIGLLGGALALCLHNDTFAAVDKRGMIRLGAALGVVQVANSFGPFPGSATAVVLAALALYLIFAAMAWRAEGSKRQGRAR